MYIKRINKGGSLLVCENAPSTGAEQLSVLKRWKGTVYHVPSLKYLAESSDASDDVIDALNSYFDSLRVGDHIDWDTKTEEPVMYTQDRNGNTLPVPVQSTRLYADIDLVKLESAVFGAKAPKTKRQVAKP